MGTLFGRVPILLDLFTPENITLSQVNSFQIGDFDKPECKVTSSSSVSSVTSEDENGRNELLETTISSGLR